MDKKEGNIFDMPLLKRPLFAPTQERESFKFAPTQERAFFVFDADQMEVVKRARAEEKKRHEETLAAFDALDAMYEARQKQRQGGLIFTAAMAMLAM